MQNKCKKKITAAAAKILCGDGGEKRTTKMWLNIHHRKTGAVDDAARIGPGPGKGAVCQSVVLSEKTAQKMQRIGKPPTQIAKIAKYSLTL